MDTKQKNFIRKKLIPFILREHGKGFGMTRWGASIKLDPRTSVLADNIFRGVPKCGYVACIGGSVDLLCPPDFSKDECLGQDTRIAPILGLNIYQAQNLFYGWNKTWPEPFKGTYEKRKTTLGKAKVAVALLKEVIRTNGAILDVLIP